MSHNNRFKFTSRWKCFVLISIIIAILVIGIPIIINELYKLNFGYWTLWTAADVLAYYSVILSGIISIVALYVTIYFTRKDTEQQIKIAQAQVNVPFFLIDSVKLRGSSPWISTGNKSSWSNELYISKDSAYQKEIIITLRNIGDGIAITPRYEINASLNPSNCSSRYVDKLGTLELKYNLYQGLFTRFGPTLLPKSDVEFENDILLCYQNVSGIKYSQHIILEHICKSKGNAVSLSIKEISPQEIV